MKARGIVFTGSSVRAIKERTKTQTRRVLKNPPDGELVFCPNDGIWIRKGRLFLGKDLDQYWRCPWGQAGDLLYVREACWLPPEGSECPVLYDADTTAADLRTARRHLRCLGWRYRPGRFMPRTAARIWLLVLSTRPERLWDITEEDCWAEGCYRVPVLESLVRVQYRMVWNDLNAKRGYPWEGNPPVWRIEFTVEEHERP